jgi:hypothetical protein
LKFSTYFVVRPIEHYTFNWQPSKQNRQISDKALNEKGEGSGTVQLTNSTRITVNFKNEKGGGIILPRLTLEAAKQN